MAEPTPRTDVADLPAEVADMAAAVAKLYTLAVIDEMTTALADIRRRDLAELGGPQRFTALLKAAERWSIEERADHD